MPVTWDFFHNKVQKALPHGQFLSGRATVIGAGPPNILTFAQDAPVASGGELVYLIGLIQSFSINQGQAVQRFYEIGSERHYFITGRQAGQISLNRILYHGPSLLRVLYAWYSSTNNFFTMGPLLPRYSSFPSGVNNHEVQIPAGEQNWFMNLASDLFSQPTGLLIMLRDQDELVYGMAYLENCYVDNLGMGTDAGGIVMSEQTNIQFERMIPIGSGAVSLVALLDDELTREAEDGSDVFVTTTSGSITTPAA